MRALLSVWDKTGLVEFARGLHELGVRARVGRRAPLRAIDEAGIPVTAPRRRSPASPTMLDHRVVTLHPKVHGGILADRGEAVAPRRHGAARHRAVRHGRHQPLPVPRVARHRDHRHRWPGDDARGGEEPRVGRRSSPTRRSTTTCSPSSAQHGALERRHAARARARGVRAHRRLRRRDRRVAPGRRGRCPQHLVLALDRTDEQLRYGENPHQQRRALPHAPAPRAGGTASMQHSGVALSYLNLYDADAAWRLAHDLGDQPDVSRSSSTPTRAASRSPATSPPRTSARSSATSAPRSAASSRSTGRSTPRRSSAWSRARRPTS